MKNRVLYRFLYSYAVLLLVPLLMGIVSYNRTHSIVAREVLESNTRLLQQTMGILNERFAEVEKIAWQLLNDEEVNSFAFVSEPFEKSTSYRLIDTVRNLYDYRPSNSFLLQFWILFQCSRMAISTNQAYTLEDFFRYKVVIPHSEDSVSADFWTRPAVKRYIGPRTGLVDEREVSIISYQQRKNSHTGNDIAVLILIDNNEIQKYLKRIDTGDGGAVFIVDKDGEIISSSPVDARMSVSHNLLLESDSGTSATSIDGRYMNIIYMKSPFNTLSYIALQSPRVVFQKVRDFRTLLLVIIAAFLTVGAAIAVFLAFRTSRPIDALIASIQRSFAPPDTPPAKNGYILIQNAIYSLVEKNRNLKTELEVQVPILKRLFIERLLEGRFNSLEEIQERARYLRIQSNFDFYTTVIMQISPQAGGHAFQELDYRRVAINDAMQDILPDDALTSIVEENRLAIILPIHAQRREQCEDEVAYIVRRVQEIVLRKLDLTLQIAVGAPYE